MSDPHTTGTTAMKRRTVSRRNWLTATALMGAAIAVGQPLWAADPEQPTTGNISRAVASALSPNMKSAEFRNGSLRIAGNLYLPEGFDPNGKYAAIVVEHPGGGVKEQIAGLYATMLAEQGFVTLTFDVSHQGASEGMPRFLDDPMKRVGDIYAAIDYLTTLPYVDATRIGALGACAGSGHAIKASTLDRRIKAAATVSAVDVDAATRKGWDGKGTVAQQIAALEAVAKQRTAEAAGAAPVYVPYVPALGDKTAPRDLQEAADYYLTPRGQHLNAPNKMLLTSASNAVAYTGFDLVETLLTQPLMVVAGNEAGSLWHSRELHAKAPGPKELVLIEGATHMDLYDGAGAVAAAKRLAPFFQKSLGATAKK